MVNEMTFRKSLKKETRDDEQVTRELGLPVSCSDLEKRKRLKKVD